MELKGYGSRVTLTGDQLRITAKGLGGKALGFDQRTIAAADVSTIDYKPASAMTNGSIRMMVGVDPILIHFTRKHSNDALALFNAFQPQCVNAAGTMPGIWELATRPAATARPDDPTIVYLENPYVDYDYEVVGESHYRDHLLRVIAAHPIKDAVDDGEIGVVALLRREPTNPHDANAVEVIVEGGRVGYIPGRDAARVGAYIAQFEARGLTAAVAAEIGWGDYPGAPIGVRLSMPPDLADFEVGAPEPFTLTPEPPVAVAPPDPASLVAAAAPVAGWYADPWGAAAYRWWDGATWTGHVHG